MSKTPIINEQHFSYQRATLCNRVCQDILHSKLRNVRFCHCAKNIFKYVVTIKTMNTCRKHPTMATKRQQTMTTTNARTIYSHNYRVNTVHTNALFTVIITFLHETDKTSRICLWCAAVQYLPYNYDCKLCISMCSGYSIIMTVNCSLNSVFSFQPAHEA